MNWITDVFEPECKKRKLKHTRVCREAGVTYDNYLKIKKKYNSNQFYRITREKAILLCIALGATYEEFQELLSYAGYTLSPDDPYDAEVNEAISKKGEPAERRIWDFKNRLISKGYKMPE